MNTAITYEDESNGKHTCIVGIGNSMRMDDGAGAFVCRQIEGKNLPSVHIIVTQQLDISMAPDLSKFQQVIFVDATLQEATPSIQPVVTGNPTQQPVSHDIDAATLVSLIKQLFPGNTRFYICAISAVDFNMGVGLSIKTMQHAIKAVSLITAWIQEGH